MLEFVFNKFADLLSEILLNERLNHGYFSMKKFYLKNTFLTGHLRVTASDTWKTDIQIFNYKYLNSSCNSNNSVLINIVGTLYLMIRNLDFVFMIDYVFRA